LPEAVELAVGWFSVKGVGVDTGCYFMWASSAVGNGTCIYGEPGNYAMTWPDLAFCLTLTGPLEGAEEGAVEGSVEGLTEGEPEGEGVMEGMEEGIEEGVLEGGEEGIVEGVAEGVEEGVLEGEEEGMAEGVAEGIEEGVAEGSVEGIEEGVMEGAEEGMVEGEGVEEGVLEGAEEGVMEGAEEGTVEGEGAEEGVMEGAEEGTVEGEGAEEGAQEGAVEGEGETVVHTADQDGDGLISLSELLRVIQFYNSFGLHCEEGTEDGYAPGPVGGTACSPHASDYNPQDWDINLSELLRVIQFFNSGGYHACSGSEDGFCPGPA